MNTPLPLYYDLSNARALVLAAREAYLEGSDLPPLTREVTHLATETRAVIIPSTTDVIVAFRGTTDLENWLTDLDCAYRRWDYPNLESDEARVHHGFGRALDGIWPELRDQLFSLMLAQPQGRAPRLWFTGHSLGAALAKLAALRFSPFAQIAGVYTFGEPRVGNGAFRDLYDARLRDRTFRVVDGEDFITRIPWLLGAYRHSGIEVFYDCEHNYHLDSRWWQKGLSDLCGTWNEYHRLRRLAAANDHHIGFYVDLLYPETRQAVDDWRLSRDFQLDSGEAR